MDTMRCQFSFALAREDLDAAATLLLTARNKGRTIGGIADGGGGNGPQILNAEYACDGAEPAQGCQRPVNALIAEPPRRRH